MIPAGNAKNIVDATLVAAVNAPEPPTMEALSRIMAALRVAFPVPDDQFTACEMFVQAKLILRMEKGVVVAPRFEKWLRHRKPDIDKFYWNRFRLYLLSQGWGPIVVNALDEVVDDLLDYAGDPHANGSWKRRGLVVGDVQSGKTATYTALCNKAADAGYRLIILLAGTLNSLRYQTQLRLDEGFIGFDSAEVLANRIADNRNGIGVGRFDNSRAPHAYTSKIGDFDASTLKIRTRLDGLSAPVLIVIKKNKGILANLHSWLQTQNPSADGKIPVPLLLIDDEADAASVNTGKESDPRAINAGIRNLLSLFSRSSYVGFTATPFANVFIAPDSRTAMLGDDLFPSDYIYSLEPPNNYIGPVKVFEDAPDQFLRYFDDAASIFPPKHKKDLQVDTLPESLVDAVMSFLLVNAIRDLRGHGNAHRSMLVNVSWANAVQGQVARLLKEELDETVRDVQAFARYSPDIALKESAKLRQLRAIWEREHGRTEFNWPQVQDALFDAIKAVVVRTVNMTSPTKRLDYDANEAKGLRVIAIGGNALSRGLTLEGLSTSYIFRNSQAYDTLLQMGRWFGYRPGFDDLCRIWMTRAAAGWYSHITRATEELRAELRRMYDFNLTPRQFGLRVRDHPDSLIVTARVKMRTAAPISEGVSLSLRLLEGARLPKQEAALAENARAVERFLAAVIESGADVVAPRTRRATHLWTGVPKSLVADLLRVFHVHPTSTNFQPQQIARFLFESKVDDLNSWDVAISSGERGNAPYEFARLRTFTVKRQLIENDGAMQIFRLRLGSAGDEIIGLSGPQVNRAKVAIAQNRARNLKPMEDYEYRKVRQRPLLLVYFVKASDSETEISTMEPALDPFVSVALSMPQYDDDGESPLVLYQANQVWQQMRLSLQAETDEDELLESDARVG
jgi:nitroreductase